MPNALLLWVALSATFAIGAVLGAWIQRRKYGSFLIRRFLVDTKATARISTEAAFARAARAVGLWPHRINRRADLMRHLESLATAPELGDCTPNPEAEDLDATTSPVRPPIPSVAPASAASPTSDPEPDDGMRVVDAYREEGFL